MRLVRNVSDRGPKDRLSIAGAGAQLRSRVGDRSRRSNVLAALIAVLLVLALAAGASRFLQDGDQQTSVEVAPLPAMLMDIEQQRTTEPVALAFAGSSTTQGQNATRPENRFVDLLTKSFQRAYPSGSGEETTPSTSVSADFDLVHERPGVHGYNAGESGTSSADYLDGEERSRLATLNPRMVMHMVGSNDAANGVTASVYKENVRVVIDDLRLKTTEPLLHVLVQPYERYDITPAVPWDEYGQALAEIAAESPDDVVYLDISPAYYAAGVPGDDPRNLISDDLIHQTDAGHALMASLLRRALTIP